ncbi:Serine/threonine-protein kinase pim-3 [Labeo rohita]|uniref:non-specific serine/threonine protein kinase n=1 Tax=Labeo rohita TaxID=84645 RepID=A0ABQ8LNY3_LABRO|nr:Serine/threonine-protein kinase pim-3 [Labeo rohita]
MVLFSLLGVIALLQRERKKVNSTHSGQEENPGQSDVPPVKSCDDRQVDHDWSKDLSLEEPIGGFLEVDNVRSEESNTSCSQVDDDDWSDDYFQELVGDLSEWSADVLHALDSVNFDSVQTPVAPDCSDDDLQATVCATSDSSEDVPPATVCATSSCSDDVPPATVCATSSCSDDVPPATVCATSSCSDDVPQATVCATSSCSDGIPEDFLCATSDSSDDVLQASCSDGIPEDFLCVTSDSSEDILQDTISPMSSYNDDVLQTAVSPMSDSSDDIVQTTVSPMAESSDDVLPTTVSTMSSCSDDVLQTTLSAMSDGSEGVPSTCSDMSDCSVDAPKATVCQTEATVPPQSSQLQDGTIIDINSRRYEIGAQLGGGGFGTVYAATHLDDGLQVAIKCVSNRNTKFISIDGYFQPLPLEVALLILANQGPRVQEIIQLLDWRVEPDYYFMVLERPIPCQSLYDYLRCYKGTIEEDVVRVIMHQVIFAAQTCCLRGVLHRDIKLENLLINPDTLEVKLIDFGCGDFLTDAGYTSFAGTREYCPPEYHMSGKYHGNQRQCECCDFIRCCLQIDPKHRLELEKLSLHDWFMIADKENNNGTIMDINSCRYEISSQLGKGGCGTIYAATRLEDGLQDGCSKPLPLEVALLILANEGPRVQEIVRLLDWRVETDHYVLVLERPMPCEELNWFLLRQVVTLEEEVARVIMRQATFAAQTCCRRGVLHRDIKMENLLINPDTLEVQLIDFGCGDFLTDEGYTSFAGTREYCPPEYLLTGKYHGEPATVWSLGVLLFALLCGDFPKIEDLERINSNTWAKDGLSKECCDVISHCLQLDPKQRIDLEKLGLHNWFTA